MSEAHKPAEGIVPLTAERLRAIASAPGLVVEFLSITGPEAAMLADALEIADESCESLLSCEAHTVDEGKGVWWHDLSSVDEVAKQGVEQAVRYLEARGILQKHPTDRHLVQLQETAD